jgi:LysM repeat protein
MTASKRLRRTHSRGGPERVFLGTALLVPLGMVLVALMQLPSVGLASSWRVNASDSAASISSQRPVSSNPAPPPTLAPPTSTPKPTETPVPAQPAVAVVATATPQRGGMYTVQPGDELKSIAADYNVSIWKIIATNKIPNPDSLRVGQELHIPSE